MNFWQLRGEAGAALDETLRDVDALGISTAQLSMGSLEVDTLTFPQVFDSAGDVDSRDIDEGQIVELYRDGVRFFRGHCTRRRARDTTSGGLQIDTTISGPWWWMQQTPLSGEINDQTGGLAERISFAFDTGDLREHIRSLIARSITLGVPIAEGSIDPCFDIPQITLKQMSCADAMAELMRWIPDSTSWIDYSTDIPTFNLSRRPTANISTLQVGQPPCTSVDINGVFELLTEQVVVSYVTRNVQGRTVFLEQVSGHDGTAVSAAINRVDLASDASESDDAYNGLEIEIVAGQGAGQTRTITNYTGSNKRANIAPNFAVSPNNTSVYRVGNGSGNDARRQIITVSGPELDSFLPNDEFDFYDGTTMPLFNLSGMAGVVASLPQFAAAVEQGMQPSNLMVPTTFPLSFAYAGSTSTLPSTPNVQELGATSYTRAADGSSFSPVGQRLLIGETPPDWLREQLGLVEVTLSGAWGYEFLFNDHRNGNDNFGVEPPWFFHLPDFSLLHSGLTGTNFNNFRSWRLHGGTWEAQGWITTSDISARIFRAADYAFVQPPPGLAANLLETQDFMPYEGEVGLAAIEAGGVSYRGSVLNVTGSLASHGQMRAIVQGVDMSLPEGSSSIRLGTPTRLNYAGLVNRFRRTASDNIIYI